MPKCDSCPKTATVNVQKLWVRYPIAKGDYGKPEVVSDFTQDPSGEENLHLCDGHYQMWLHGNL